MTTISNSAIIPIAPASTEVESAGLTVLPLAAPGEGRGRIIHPVLGTYDYPYAPDEWMGIDGDVIVPPVWAHAMTLGGGADTLWDGDLRDVEVEERWISEVMPIEHLRMLLAIWTQPPNPDSGVVEWWPQYTTTLGYQVAVIEVTAGGRGVTLDYVTRQDYVRGPVAIRMRIIDRA